MVQTCRVHGPPRPVERATAFNKSPRWLASTSRGLRSAALYYPSLFCPFENVHHRKNGKIKELAYEKSFRAKIGTVFFCQFKNLQLNLLSVFEASRNVLTSLHKLSHSILLPAFFPDILFRELYADGAILFSPLNPWGQEPGRCSLNICLISEAWTGQAFAYCLFVSVIVVVVTALCYSSHR